MVYTIINQRKLGSGSYGDVYVVEDEHGEKMAVKIIDPAKLSLLELDILTRLKSPYIVRSVGDPVISIQHAHGITLQLKENCLSKINAKKLPYYQLKRIMVSCLFGLRCMHSKGFLHNDLVLRNILYDKDENDDYLAYLSDFSVSVRCIDAKQGIRVRRVVKGSHMPYEILEGLIEKKKIFRYNDKTDIWSLGICFLELIDKKYFFNNMSEQMEFFDSISSDFIKGKIRLYNRLSNDGGRKMSKKEEIYLTELITHMLKKNPEDRMGTGDIMYLNFIRTTSIPYDCSINKPSEMVVVPVGEVSLRNGVETIREYFRKNPDSLLSSYFLALQIYVRMMNRIVVEDSDFNNEEVIQIAIDSARNYYDRKIVAGYEAGIILRGEIGYSPYYYAANFVEELKLVDKYIDEGDNFLTIFNFLNPFELFYQFRLMYDYGDENRITNRITYLQYLEIENPRPKENIDAKIYLPHDYSNIIDGKDGSVKSSIEKEKEIEEIFNGILVDYIKNKVKVNFSKDFPDIYELAKNYIEGGTRIKSKDVYKKIRNQDIFTKLIGINEYFEYGIILIETGNIIKHVFHDRKFVIVVNDGITSLIYNPGKEDKKIEHLYSEPVKTLKNYYSERGYEYEMNFEYGINSCCKVIDSCVLFIVFYNNYVKNSDDMSFTMKCISEETNFIIFLSLFL